MKPIAHSLWRPVSRWLQGWWWRLTRWTISLGSSACFFCKAYRFTFITKLFLCLYFATFTSESQSFLGELWRYAALHSERRNMAHHKNGAGGPRGKTPASTSAAFIGQSLHQLVSSGIALASKQAFICSCVPCRWSVWTSLILCWTSSWWMPLKTWKALPRQ